MGIVAQRRRCGPSTCRLLADANQDLGSGADRPLGQGSRNSEIDLAGIDIRQLAGIDIEEMMVRLGTRIVILPDGIDVDRAQQTALAKQLQRVVDGRLGYARIERMKPTQNFLGTDVPGSIEEETCDLQTLRCRLDSVSFETTR